MSNNTTTTSVDLTINGQQAQQTLAQLRQNALQLETAIAKAAAAGNKTDLKQLRKDLASTKKQMKEIESATQQVDRVMRRLDKATPRELSQTLSTLNRQLNYMERGSAAWNAHIRKIQMVKAEIARVNTEIRAQQGFLERLNGAVSKWQNAFMGAAAAATGLVMAGRSAVQAFAEMDSTLANTRKFTGIEGDELKRLNDELSKIQTRTSLADLHGLAQEAGRLGKDTVEDVVGYVRAADQLTVALDDLGEGATQTMATVTEIFGVEAEMGTEKALLAVGSTINELSQNCSAGMGYIADFTQRMAGTGATAKMTVPEIMAFAAVLDTQGQSCEASATALQKLINDAFKNAPKFAKALGVSLEEFNGHMSNTTEGLIWMFEKFRDTGGIDKLAPLLGEMGENGSRTSSVFAALANKVDFVKQQINAANTAFEEGTSVTNEYNIVNDTFQAKLDQAKKRSTALAVELGEKLAPVMMYIHSATYYLLRVLRLIVDFFIKYKGAIITVTAALVAYKVATIASTAASKAQAAWEGIVIGLYKAKYAATLLLKSATALLTFNVTAAKEAWKKFAAVLQASPVGLAAAAITAVVAGLALWATKGKEVNAIERDRLDIEKKVNEETGAQIGIVQNLVKRINEENLSNNERIAILGELKRRTGLQNLELDKNNKLTATSINLINKWIEATQLRAKAKVIQDKIEEIEKERYETEEKRKKAEEEREKNARNIDYGNAGMNMGIHLPSFDRQNNRTAGQQVVEDRIAQYKAEEAELMAREKALIGDLGKTQVNINNMTVVEPEKNYDNSAGGGGYVPPKVDSTTSTGRAGHGNIQKEETYLEKQAKIHEQNILRLQIAYMKGQQNYEEYVNAMEEENKRYYEDVTTNTQVGESDRLKLQKEYLEKAAEYESNRRAKSLQEVDEEYKELNVKAMQNYVNGELSKAEYEEAINRLELESLQKKRKVLSEQMDMMRQQGQAGSQQYEELSKRYAEANKEYLNKMIADQEEKAKKAAEVDEKEREERERILREHNQSLQSLRDEYFGMNAFRAKQEYDAMMKLLDEQKAIELAEVANLENADDEKLRIEEAYQKARLALAKKYNQDQLAENENFLQKWVSSSQEWLEGELGQAVTKSVDVISSGMKSIFSQLTTIISAEAQVESSKVEEFYDQQISAAEGNRYKEVQLEKEKKEKIAKIKNDAEKKKYKMEVISAIAQTAQAAINAYSSAAAVPLVGYILAPIAAGAAIAAGMLQVAALKKQQQASEAQGYEGGGFTPDGLPDTPAGIVHAGEWVASQRLTKNRRIRPILEALDSAQRTNRVGSLSDEYVTKTITAPMVLAETYSRAQQGARRVVVENNQPKAIDKELAETISLLRYRLDEPFITVNTVTGDGGIKQAQDEYDKLIRNKTPKSRRKNSVK